MDTKLFVRKASGGLFAVIDKSLTTGNIWWVDSGSATGADSAGYGKNPDAPFLTLDFAIGQTTANNGDIIYVMPGHSETYSTTGAKNIFDMAGVKVIGLGSGSDRPTFTFSHTGATQTISAANTWLENLLFVAGIDSVTTFGTISGDDCTLKDIETRDTTDIEVITDWTVTGDRLQVYNYFKNGYLSGNANVRVFSLNGVDGAYFDSACRFLTKVTTAIIGFVTAACTGISIDGGTFYVSGTAYTKDIVDTISGSSWVAHGYDIEAGAGFSGGTAGTPAGDDVGAVSTAVSTVNSIVTTVSAGVSTNTSRLTAQSSSVSTISSIVTTTSAGVSTVNSIATTTSAGVSTNTSRLTANSNALSTINSIVTTGSNGVSTADSRLISVATVAGNTSTGVSTNTSIVTTVSGGVSTADSRLISVATVAGNTSTGVSANTSIVTNTSTGVSTVNSIVTTVSAGVSTVNSIVTTASAGVSTADSKIVSVATVVGNTSTGVSTNASIVTTISAGVSTVSSIATVLNNWDVRTVSKAAIALDAGTVNSVFTVAGGPVECLGLILLVTTAVSANNCTMKWQNDPDLAVAATTDLCGTVDLISAAIGDMFATVGASGSAAVKYASGTATGLMNTTSAIIQAGAVNLVLANADPTTGAGTAYLVYRPLANGAAVTAP